MAAFVNFVLNDKFIERISQGSNYRFPEVLLKLRGRGLVVVLFEHLVTTGAGEKKQTK